MDTKNISTVDGYIATFPSEVQHRLKKIRSIIQKSAPTAVESISYGMPAYKLNGKPLVYFAGYEKHIGFYATPSGHEAFIKELSKYKQGKGSVQFPLDEPLPLDLISRIVEFRVMENQEIDKPGKVRASLFDGLSAPAQRALENNGIRDIKTLSRFTEKEVQAFHGIGKSSIPKLKELLKSKGLSFKIQKRL